MRSAMQRNAKKISLKFEVDKSNAAAGKLYRSNRPQSSETEL